MAAFQMFRLDDRRDGSERGLACDRGGVFLGSYALVTAAKDAPGRMGYALQRGNPNHFGPGPNGGQFAPKPEVGNVETAAVSAQSGAGRFRRATRNSSISTTTR